MLTAVKNKVVDYYSLTKPGVMSLLLFTTFTAMMIAAGGMPSWRLAFFTLVGGALASASSAAINMYFDRDIDAQMKRTATRPIPAGRIAPRAALAFGILLAAASFVLMTLTLNLLAASLALAGFVGYVGVYTLWLKRRTVQNIVIGGAAGAVPPLVGWASVRGSRVMARHASGSAKVATTLSTAGRLSVGSSLRALAG